MSELTWETLQKAIELLGDLPPRPAIFFSKAPFECSLHGPFVDQMLGLDPKKERGFIVPEKSRRYVEENLKDGFREVFLEDVRRAAMDRFVSGKPLFLSEGGQHGD